MTLRRRLLIYLLGGAVLAWAAAIAISVPRARHEVNELFDTELIRLARQVQSLIDAPELAGRSAGPALPALEPAAGGEADMDDLAIAVWDGQGRLQFTDREGAALPHANGRAGFVDLRLGGDRWRVYYLHSFEGDWLVAAGQKTYERDEMVYELTSSQLLPWLLVLPVLMLAITLGVHRALSPVQRLVKDLGSRSAHELEPIATYDVPADLVPMVEAINALFGRIEVAIVRERAFTEDAAHELRTPLAVLRAQWDVLRRTVGAPERESAAASLGAGLERMERLVTQMLALSRLDSSGLVIGCSPIDWREMVEDVFSDCLPLAVARNVELACEWPPGADAPIAVNGDPELVRVMLRNLLDNATRYAPPGSTVTLRIANDRVELENAGRALAPEVLARFGERFFRPDGQESPGSGLGVSIVQRIAALHGLEATWAQRRAGDGVLVTLRAAAGGPATSAREPFAAARALPRGAPRPRPGAPDEAAPQARARGT